MSAARQEPVVIECAAMDDAAALHEIARRTFVHATPPDADPAAIDELVATQLSEAAFAGHIDSPASRLLIARRGTTPIGYALLLDRPGPSAAAEVDPDQPLVRGRGLFLSKLYLLPEARGTDASTALVEAVLRVGAEIGADYLWLTVNQLNPRANAFYERAGLRVVGTARFPLGPRVHDDWVRARRI